MTQTNALTKPATATAFPLRLRLHYKAARAGGVMRALLFGINFLKVLVSP
jgi:hypothetical protein